MTTNTLKTKGTIFHVCFSTAWGGLEMNSAKWTKIFHDHGYDAILITSIGSKAGEWAKAQGVPVEELPYPRDYFSLSTRRGLIKLLKKHRPVGVYNHLTRDLWHLTPVLKKFPDIKLFAFARMFLRGVNKKDFLHRYIYSRLNRMIALSHPQKVELLKCLPIDDKTITVIPNPVDTEKFSPKEKNLEFRKEFSIEENDFLVGLVGRLDPLKGHMELIEAAGEIIKSHPNVKFVFVGASTAFEGNQFAREIRNRIEDLGIKENIIFTGHRTDVPEILNSLDIFCMPSYEENFGNVMLEALSSGLACIGTNSGGTPDMIEDKESGLLVEPKSSNSLVEGIRFYLENADFKKSIEKKARQQAEAKFSKDRVFKMVESLLFQN